MQHITNENQQHKPSEPMVNKVTQDNVVDGDVVDLYGSAVPKYKADSEECTMKVGKTNQTRFGMEERGVPELA